MLADGAWMPYPKSASGLAVPTLTIGTVTDVTATCAEAVSGEYNGCFDIDVSTDAIALYVWIEAVGEHIRVMKLKIMGKVLLLYGLSACL